MPTSLSHILLNQLCSAPAAPLCHLLPPLWPKRCWVRKAWRAWAWIVPWRKAGRAARKMELPAEAISILSYPFGGACEGCSARLEVGID